MSKKYGFELEQSVTIEQAARIMLHNCMAGIGTFLIGTPGIGKTSVFEQVCKVLEEKKRKDGSPFIEGHVVFSTTEMTSIDLGGLYHADAASGRTRRFPLETIDIEKRLGVFIDELADCPPHEQSGWYALANDHRIGTKKLAEGSFVCGAANPVGSTTAAREISSALKDRACVLHVRPDYRSVVRHALKRGWSDRVVGFLMHLGADVIDNGFDRNDPVGGSTPRGWERVSVSEKTGALVEDLAVHQVAGNVGYAAAEKYIAFRDLDIPDVKLVFKNPHTAPIFAGGDADSEAIKFAYVSAVMVQADIKDKGQCESVIRYLMRLDRPTAVLTIQDFAMRRMGAAKAVLLDAYKDALNEYKDLAVAIDQAKK
ncbi:MAG: hypothetical protein KatS3mg109_0088 [Pirellulaceae bacterium]|nr:MAG: hypothetical protein KatS3mg109_0088 [Pirellulaceae bacterium]